MKQRIKTKLFSAFLAGISLCILTGCVEKVTYSDTASSPEESTSLEQYSTVVVSEDGISLPQTSSADVSSGEGASSSSGKKPNISSPYHSGDYSDPIPYGNWTSVSFTADSGVVETDFRIVQVLRNSAINSNDEAMMFYLGAMFTSPELIENQKYQPYAIIYEISIPDGFTGTEYSGGLSFAVVDNNGKTVATCSDNTFAVECKKGDIVSGTACALIPLTSESFTPVLYDTLKSDIYFYGIDEIGEPIMGADFF